MNVRSTLLLAACVTAFGLQAGEKKEHHAHKHEQKHEEHGFIKQAEEYDAKAEMYEAKSNEIKQPGPRAYLKRLASHYNQLADHKRAAAKAQKQGKGYDWKRYHKIQEKVASMEEKIHIREQKHHRRQEKVRNMQDESREADKGERMAFGAAVEKSSKPTSYQEASKAGSGKAHPSLQTGDKTYTTQSGFIIRTAL